MVLDLRIKVDLLPLGFGDLQHYTKGSALLASSAPA